MNLNTLSFLNGLVQGGVQGRQAAFQRQIEGQQVQGEAAKNLSYADYLSGKNQTAENVAGTRASGTIGAADARGGAAVYGDYLNNYRALRAVYPDATDDQIRAQLGPPPPLPSLGQPQGPSQAVVSADNLGTLPPAPGTAAAPQSQGAPPLSGVTSMSAPQGLLPGNGNGLGNVPLTPQSAPANVPGGSPSIAPPTGATASPLGQNVSTINTNITTQGKIGIANAKNSTDFMAQVPKTLGGIASQKDPATRSAMIANFNATAQRLGLPAAIDPNAPLTMTPQDLLAQAQTRWTGIKANDQAALDKSTEQYHANLGQAALGNMGANKMRAGAYSNVLVPAEAKALWSKVLTIDPATAAHLYGATDYDEAMAKTAGQKPAIGTINDNNKIITADNLAKQALILKYQATPNDPGLKTSLDSLDAEIGHLQRMNNNLTQQSGLQINGPGANQGANGLSTDPVYGGKFVSSIQKYAQQYGVDPRAVQAIIKQETGGNPAAINRANRNGTVDYGLMQVNSATKDPKSYNWKDPDANIAAGVQEFKNKLDAAGGNYQLAFQMYNGSGPAARAYGQKVFTDYQRLKGSGQPPPQVQAPTNTIQESLTRADTPTGQLIAAAQAHKMPIYSSQPNGTYIVASPQGTVDTITPPKNKAEFLKLSQHDQNLLMMIGRGELQSQNKK